MSDDEDELRRYVSLSEAFPMAWDESADAVVWRGSERTVAFRQEIASAAEMVLRQDLVPHFPAMLAAFSLVRELRSGAGTSDNPKLDLGLCSSPVLTAAVVAHILEGSNPAVDRERAGALLRGLASGLPREGLSRPDAGVPAEEQLAAAREAISVGVQRADPEVILRRARTGLESEVVALPEEVVLDDAARVLRLLDELGTDAEHAGLARVARDLMAALRLPQPVARRRGLPVGGYADIASRGELDRLLLSELAQDDDVLASRIVLGEALYLRREVPRESPSHDLVLVLDAGIRTWGIARLFSTASALALAARAHRGARVIAQRARGQGLEDVDLTTRAGLDDHLGTLTPDPHPGAALAALDLRAAGEATRRVLVTTRAAFESAPLRRALADGPDWSVVAVDAEGRVELHEVTRRGSRLVRCAHVALDDLLAAGEDRPKEDLRRRSAPLPAYFEDHPAPLVLAHDLGSVSAIVSESGTFLVLPDRRVTFWPSPSQDPTRPLPRPGAHDLGVLPPGHLLAFEVLGDRAVAVTFDQARRELSIFWAGPGWRSFVRTVPMPSMPLVYLRDGSFVARRGEEWWTPRDEGLVPAEPLPPSERACRRPRSGPYSSPRIHTSPLLMRVRSVGVLRDPSAPGPATGGTVAAPLRLVLFGRRNAWWLDLSDASSARLRRLPFPWSPKRPSLQGVGSTDPRARFLRARHWRDGSIAWLDRRGLLHLRSGESRDGDLTMTLDVHRTVEFWMPRRGVIGAGSPGDSGHLEAVRGWIERFAERIERAGERP